MSNSASNPSDAKPLTFYTGEDWLPEILEEKQELPSQLEQFEENNRLLRDFLALYDKIMDKLLHDNDLFYQHVSTIAAVFSSINGRIKRREDIPLDDIRKAVKVYRDLYHSL